MVESNSSTTAGPAICASGRQRVAVVDRAVDVAARLGEVDLAPLLRLGRLPAASERSGGFAIRPTVVSRRLTHSIGSSSAAEAVGAVVLGVEALEQRLGRLARERRGDGIVSS